MRHRYARKRMGRTSSHRAALRSNFICSVIKHERVVTTLERAKAVRRNVEKVITLGKTKTRPNIRRALALLGDRDVVRKLFEEIGPRYANRPGGYTRTLRLSGYRIGDGGSKAIFELVDNNVLEAQLAPQEDVDAEE
ncbi:MAG: 50S ribosomal protein L17 [Planctomycetes bacterium]|nr:50S ribosomal protein L17 [Planctomycetota bacterium]MCB9871657.1 50S ribosomal protein L17 [Planctomycetota bacterium]